MLASLQRKTLIETKNRTLKCLKRHNSTVVRSMKNVAVLTENRAFALIHFSSPSRGIWQLKSPTKEIGDVCTQAKESPSPGICYPRPKNVNARGSARGGGAGRSWNWRNMSKTCASVSSGVPDTEKQISRNRFCFEVSGTSDETRSTSFWHDFSNRCDNVVELFPKNR